MACGRNPSRRKTAFTIRLTLVQRQTLLVWQRAPTISEMASLANRRASWVNVSPSIRTIRAMIAIDAADGISRLLR